MIIVVRNAANCKVMFHKDIPQEEVAIINVSMFNFRAFIE